MKNKGSGYHGRCMALNIRDEEIDRLARELAERAGRA
jgi:hypothetical protein